VRELLAHFVGCPIDLAAANVDGAGSESWTQGHVDARSEATIGDLLAEWRGAAPAIDKAIRGGAVPVPITLDVLTHESDLRGAIGAPRTPEPRAIRFVIDGFGERAVTVAAKRGLPPLELRAIDSEWSVGEAGGGSAAASEYEWSRALAGRRSQRQVLAFNWSGGDGSEYLDVLSPFGPLPTEDIVD
jgi:hypothetical protein